ncbi:MAG: L,D-transpeptidase [Planctomycetota bacterium]|nr:L,D-transpeptidase [Planctomycetota bacterium]
MKAFVIIVILVVGGWFAWTKWGGADPVEGDATEQAGDSAFNAVDDGDAEPPEGDQASGDLSADLEALLKDSERRWELCVAEGRDPALDKQAPKLALDYSTVLKATYNVPAMKEMQERIVTERLLPLSAKLFFSKYRYNDDETGIFKQHKVAQGERPDSIGRDYGMSYQFINLMRERPAEDGELKLGENLKVLAAKEHGGYYVHVDKGDYFADVYACGILVKRFAVGVGAIETPSPLGKAHIDMRSLEPDWTDPNSGEVYAWNDERNLLGRVWLRLKADEIGQDGIGLHGYNGNPEQAVKVQASNGCIRMRNPDAELLYNIMVPVGYYPTEGFLQRAKMLVEIVE